jgi:UDP-N-acetylglucosamine--N-acetylmuramyl-(pentapeptide) pyrophosphoryl-undecaprenol N-acetylglucosamine transferase
MIAALRILSSTFADKLLITHQTGDKNFDEVKNAYKEIGWADADVRPYISNMVEAFDHADIIICRAGATTCAEVAAAGMTAIMIPFPGAADDHQRKNAEAMVEKGAARMILQSDLSGERLAAEIANLAADPNDITRLGRAAKTMARSDAAEVTVDLIDGLARGKG